MHEGFVFIFVPAVSLLLYVVLEKLLPQQVDGALSTFFYVLTLLAVSVFSAVLVTIILINFFNIL